MKINNILMLILVLFSFGLYGCATQAQDEAGIEEQPTEEVIVEEAVDDEEPVEEVIEEETEVLVEERWQSLVNDLFNGGIVTLYFDYDQSVLKEESINLLNGVSPALTVYLEESADSYIQLDGHADNRGTRTYNQALGTRRANSVSRHLRALEINAAQIQVTSYGEDSPAVNSNNNEAWAANRRVELYFKNN